MKKEIIKKLIGVSGLKDVEIAKKLGISKSLLSYHMKKDSDISDDLYNDILKVLPKEAVKSTNTKENNQRCSVKRKNLQHNNL